MKTREPTALLRSLPPMSKRRQPSPERAWVSGATQLQRQRLRCNQCFLPSMRIEVSWARRTDGASRCTSICSSRSTIGSRVPSPGRKRRLGNGDPGACRRGSRDVPGRAHLCGRQARHEVDGAGPLDPGEICRGGPESRGVRSADQSRSRPALPRVRLAAQEPLAIGARGAEAQIPVFRLTPAACATGGNASTVQIARSDFRVLAEKISRKTGVWRSRSVADIVSRILLVAR